MVDAESDHVLGCCSKYNKIFIIINRFATIGSFGEMI